LVLRSQGSLIIIIITIIISAIQPNIV